MTDLGDVPEELKHIVPFLQRAQELSTHDPIVSYFCKYHAARLSLTTTSPSAQTYLAQLLDQLEHEKQALVGRAEMQDDAAALAHCAGFALRVFAKADSEDRAGVNVGRATARGFIVASQFLQMLECLGGKMEDGVVEKIRYAKWRAAEILRAVREGREPERPKDEAGDGNNVVPDIAGLSVSPSPSQSLSSPPPQPQSQPQPQPHPHPMDTLPAVPRSTVSSPPPAQQQQQPRVSATPSTPQPSLDRVSATFTPVAASSLPQLHDSDGALLVDPADAKTAQKHARWAISALEYDDVEAAVENLRKAIDVLQPYRKAQD